MNLPVFADTSCPDSLLLLFVSQWLYDSPAASFVGCVVIEFGIVVGRSGRDNHKYIQHSGTCLTSVEVVAGARCMHGIAATPAAHKVGASLQA